MVPSPMTDAEGVVYALNYSCPFNVLDQRRDSEATASVRKISCESRPPDSLFVTYVEAIRQFPLAQQFSDPV